MLFLLSGSETASLKLPLGLPGFGATLSLDPLSGVFLLPLLVAAGACCLGSEPGRTSRLPARAGAATPAALAAMTLVLLAGDAFTLLLAATSIPVASAVLAPRSRASAPPGPSWAFARAALAAALAGLCLTAAIALLLPSSSLLPGAVFAAIRSHPPQGWRAAAVLGLTLLGTAPLCFAFPLREVLTPDPAAVPAPLAAAAPLVGLYVLSRLLLDLCGPATPLWWGVPLLAVAAAAAILGGLRAAGAPALPAIVAGAGTGTVGLAFAGLGVALIARGADLPLLAALSLGGVMLQVVVQGPLGAVLLLAAEAIERSAGSSTLDRLGGLIQRMPVAASVLLLAVACLARLPLFAGFPGAWMILQALLQATRIGGLWLQLGLAGALLALAFGTALLAAAGLRLVGTALLGRPRSPRGAAADDAPPRLRKVLLALACLLLALGLLPPLVLSLAAPAIAQLSLAVSADAVRGGVWTLSPQHDPAGYAVLPLLLVAGVAAALLAWATRRMPRADTDPPGWESGFAAPPPWLPFGDPATQLGAAAVSAPLLRAIGLPRPRVPASAGLAVRRLLRLLRDTTGTLDALGNAAAGLLVLTLALLCGLLWGVP